VSTYQGTSGGPRTALTKQGGTREDGVLTGRSPSISSESSSEEESSSEGESEEEDKMPPTDVSWVSDHLRLERLMASSTEPPFAVISSRSPSY